MINNRHNYVVGDVICWYSTDNAFFRIVEISDHNILLEPLQDTKFHKKGICFRHDSIDYATLAPIHIKAIFPRVKSKYKF
jgi:hypothetical protein